MNFEVNPPWLKLSLSPYPPSWLPSALMLGPAITSKQVDSLSKGNTECLCAGKEGNTVSSKTKGGKLQCGAHRRRTYHITLIDLAQSSGYCD
jgi:hypothetical protein